MPHAPVRYCIKAVLRGTRYSGFRLGAALLVVRLGAALVIGAPLAASPAGAQTALSRNQIQHLLRRLAFSAPPATVTATLASGIAPWLAAEENWSALDDSNTGLETLPTALVNGGYPDCNIFDRQRP